MLKPIEIETIEKRYTREGKMIEEMIYKDNAIDPFIIECGSSTTLICSSSCLIKKVYEYFQKPMYMSYTWEHRKTKYVIDLSLVQDNDQFYLYTGKPPLSPVYGRHVKKYARELFPSGKANVYKFLEEISYYADSKK